MTNDYTKNFVFVAVAKVAAANSDCITGFAVTREADGFIVTFDNYDGQLTRRCQAHISNDAIATMGNPARFIEQMLQLRLDSLRRQLCGKEEKAQARSKEGVQGHLCARVCRPCTTPMAGSKDLRPIPQTDLSGID